MSTAPVAMFPAAEDIRGLLEPTGYRILIFIPPQPEATHGGIIKTEERRRAEQTASMIGQVVALGPDCYKDSKRFPDGRPWCAPGDFVLMKAYAGISFRRAGCPFEYRLINDDTVEAVIHGLDPAEIERPS
jgi:co-chaperonin GroES (HSP10)